MRLHCAIFFAKFREMFDDVKFPKQNELSITPFIISFASSVGTESSPVCRICGLMSSVAGTWAHARAGFTDAAWPRLGSK